ncbi:cytochrome b family protein [Nonomuraea antri]|uniref:hypothetical protein n=1 Tax=Nonomuraea antri TaxID=2730852 RepID=UPI001568EE41|nr:hypothetical protein [Nonomuraea antri]
MKIGPLATALDDRFGGAGFLNKAMRKAFANHWTFLLGEIALYAFVVVLVTGVFLTFFFKPSMEEVVYDGACVPLRGVMMSQAFASSLEISFEVRGGLLMRQMHHWGTLIFIAAIVAHLLRSSSWLATRCGSSMGRARIRIRILMRAGGKISLLVAPSDRPACETGRRPGP